ncbi:oligosaccharide flippase family protein [Cohnella ginsengisoli]|uniref:Oligosaccharide flippase family protein n=1 Tax=Cohnella ginsengisoli TaxID=425004 RepID=A0A9X4QQD7_9BACL|nr:oligosaccharide flippase family protein [Cohnella ginsengisoli]MDG0795304.1 oligosaccharide flippase family protein [Cohnella ginsengisoli]
MKSQSSQLMRGAALLGGAALLSKLIGTLQKIPLQNLAGDRVFGLYSAVYALAVMWMTLAAAGIPVAVSALVAERVAAGDERGARRLLRYAAVLLSASGLLAFAVLWSAAVPLAAWMGAPEAADAIRASSLALLAAPLTAALRGYSQGRLEMGRPALSQLAEQCARVAFMLCALGWALRRDWSAASTAAAVHGGLAAGAVAGLAAMLISGRRSRAYDRAERGASAAAKEAAVPTESGRVLLRRIIRVALPVAAGSVVAPLFGLIDAFTLPRFLQSAGDTAAAAMSAFGEYNRGVALLQLVSMAAGGAAAALVPSLTMGRGSAPGIDAESATRAAFAMRLAWWFGGAAAVGLAILARPINVALFADARGTAAMAVLGAAALGAALQAVSAAVLQGLGDLRAPALDLALAALVKAALNAALVPAFGIVGAAAAAACAYGAAAALNLRALPAPRFAAAGRPALALAALAATAGGGSLALSALTRGLAPRAAALLTALPCIALGALAFAAALAASGALGPREWRALPGVAGSRAERWLLRLQPASRRAIEGAAEPGGTPPAP